MLPQTEYESPMYATDQAPVAIAAVSQDRALIGLLRSVVDPTTDLILVSSETELVPHLNSRRVSVALLDSMFIDGDLAAMAERLRATWPELVLVVVGTAEEQSRVASQITSGVVYRFLHRPVSAPRVRLFVEAALRRHEIESVERTLAQVPSGVARVETKKKSKPGGPGAFRAVLPGLLGAAAIVAASAAWYSFSSRSDDVDAASPPVAAPAPSETRDPLAQPSPQATTPPVTTAPAVAQARPEAARSEAPVAPETSALPADLPATLPPAAAEDSPEPEGPAVVRVPEESTPQDSPALSREQRLADMLAQAEAALQRGELASPAGRNAVALFTGALEIDPGNTLAKAGLVRVADRLLSAAERALTAGNIDDAKNMVDVAESLTPATSRGAFLMMQIEMERERKSLARPRATEDAPDKSDTGAGYLRLAQARVRSGDLIEPPGDNARFYLESARQLIPQDPGLAEATRQLQQALLDRAAAAAGVGNAAETERWLANADGAGAPRADMAAIRRSLQDTMINARAAQLDELTRSFNAALSANRLLQPDGDNAKAHLFTLLQTDASSPAAASARRSLGAAYVNELQKALARQDVNAAGNWLDEARLIGHPAAELDTLAQQIATAREQAAQRDDVVGSGSLQRIEYVAPKFPASARNRGISGWVELEYTVRTDGSTGDIVVTNSSPRRTFDNAAINAVSQWRYKPVIRGGKAVEQRAAVRIRFADQ